MLLHTTTHKYTPWSTCRHCCDFSEPTRSCSHS